MGEFALAGPRARGAAVSHSPVALTLVVDKSMVASRIASGPGRITMARAVPTVERDWRKPSSVAGAVTAERRRRRCCCGGRAGAKAPAVAAAVTATKSTRICMIFLKFCLYKSVEKKNVLFFSSLRLNLFLRLFRG